MSVRAWIYLCGVLLVAALFSGLAWHNPAITSAQWLTFAALASLTTVAQLHQVRLPNKVYYSASPIFIFATMLLLPAPLLVLVIVLPRIIEWTKARITKSALLRHWYLQPFNIAKGIIAAGGAQQLYSSLVVDHLAFSRGQVIAAAVGAALLYTLLNELLLGIILVLARNISWRESGLLTIKSWLPDFVMTLIGLSVAVQWTINPWLILPALAPLAFIYRALMIPQLEYEAQTDAKTGLVNARYLTKTLADELDRATRTQRPLAVIMADLDLLRNINNTYGHLAGDVVLEGIGRLIRSTTRAQDIAGRFGGEEFCIVLPDTRIQEAERLAERLRATIQAHAFALPGDCPPLHVTMSLGVACFPGDATTTTDLMHAADVAVYEAKRQGRNRVVSYRDATALTNPGRSDAPIELALASVPAKARAVEA